MRRLNYKKAAIALFLSAAFVLGIPSLPLRSYHLLFWGIALLIEVLVLLALRPLERNSD